MTNDIRKIVHHGIRAERAADKLTVSSSARGGFTSWHKRKVIEVSAPMGAGASARTIRIHEILHANNTAPLRKSKIHPIAINAIEDAYVHSVYWPNSMPRKANRDCLATALADARTIAPAVATGRAEAWNTSLLVALRSMSMVRRLGSHKQIDRLKARILPVVGPIVWERLSEILQRVLSRRNKRKAYAEFTALLFADDGSEFDGRGKGSTGAATAEPMRIVKLPLTENCNAAVRRLSLARSGARLNRARIVRAVANSSTVGLFIRQRYLAGGTYLFDASGSMGLTA